MSYIPQEEKEMIAKIVSKLKECNMSLINYSTSGALRILSDCVMSKPLCKIFIKYEKEIKSLIKISHTVVEVATGEPVRVCDNLDGAKLALGQCEAYDLYFDMFTPNSYFIVKNK